MKTYYLYILYSTSSDKYYIGHSWNYKERLIHHNTDDKNTFTSKHKPWILKAVFEIGNDRGEALKVEKFIKKQKSRNLLQQLIDPDFVPKGRLAQLVRVPHVRD